LLEAFVSVLGQVRSQMSYMVVKCGRRADALKVSSLYEIKSKMHYETALDYIMQCDPVNVPSGETSAYMYSILMDNMDDESRYIFRQASWPEKLKVIGSVMFLWKGQLLYRQSQEEPEIV
jgi:hypothetical protein